ncbi:hypothetical protein [Nesterenkonia xinjiangensis]|uniref:Uncharacterized protein n=1 Tax=Nesterenkonia xinjiangensis TaxID=225327 RepID=A0A7Z0K9G1_9MICC|nr:hypothetical protein [Nesterenkonia xinjiangensis]NYJ78709.1 hypothetical protein [Nesterenkonia xinjiangensis]
MTDPTPRRTPSPLLQICRGPIGQGLASGAVALIPVRRYPRWLRETIVWAPSITMAGMFLCPEQAQRIARQIGLEGDERAEPPRSEADGEAEAECESPLAVRLAAAGFFGGAAYAVMRTGLWADTALESGLRRLRVPAPRVVLALAGGVVTWRIAEMERRQADGQGTPG